jgi:glutamyl-tRNA reductase
MHILSIGLNHTTAPLHLRERLAFNEDSLRALFANPRYENSDIAGMVILSTCNRIELYATTSRPDFAVLETFLAKISNVPLSQFRPHLYHFAGADAVRHLFSVAAGLDSLVLGESQILGQVSKAFDLARELGMAEPALSRLFQAAIHAGKRVHAETAIGRNPASVASLAASIAERAVADIATAQVAILGAGEMAGLAVEALRKRGAKRILLINRSPQRLHNLSERWDAGCAPFDRLGDVLADTDILIASTSAASILVSCEMIETAMRQRPNRPLLLVDIAVPRNIDPEAGSIPNVSLYDIDHLNTRLEQSLVERQAEVPHAEAILAEEESKFLEYLNSLMMLPLIAGLRQQAEAIREAELAKTLRHLPDLSDAERTHLKALTHALVSKLLYAPTNRLRVEATGPHAPEYAAVTRSLFNLPDGAVCPGEEITNK